MSGLVVVGASYAGVQTVVTARELGYAGPITLVGNEGHIPYQRPPLSKGLLLGTSSDTLMLRGENFFTSQRIDLVLGREVAEVDRAARRITTSGGDIYPYDTLVLATGSRARRIDIPGADLQGVHYLRSLDDARALQTNLRDATSIVVIGGGFIGLEVASAAVTLGKRVTVLEAAPCLLQRGVSRVMADYMLALHERKGTRIVLGAQAREIASSSGQVAGVSYNAGQSVDCDLVVVGIGGLTNDSLATTCGLACDNGIVVDEFGRTSDPQILSAGDCSSHPSHFAKRRLRLESVQNALDQGRTAGATAAGKPVPYTAVPRFWSDQFDAKLQMVGLCLDHDTQVIRGVPESGRFSVFLFKGEDLVGVDSVNSPGDHVAGRKLFGAGASLRPEQAGDAAFDLKAFSAAAR